MKLLPLHINALYLESPEQVIGQDIRFENIPWMNEEKGVFENPNTPLETNSIIPRPFSYDNAIYLEKGVHLHFVLPAHFKKFDEQGNLPLAPNRWYVKNERTGKEYVIESDYIWNVNDEKLFKYNTCTYVEGEEGKDFNFHYVGRRYSLDEWNTRPKHTNYLKSLTALGWGSMSFDVHYPNCRSIFGFHDPDGNENDVYSIIGWVDKKEEFIVAGRFKLEESTGKSKLINFDVSIANSLQETLVALLTDKNNDTDKIKIEEQIESILNFDELNDLKLDWLSRLRIKRHEKQFNKISGTTQYIINITKNNINVASDGDNIENEVVGYDIDVSNFSYNLNETIDESNESNITESNSDEIIRILNTLIFDSEISVNEKIIEKISSQIKTNFNELTQKDSKYKLTENLYFLNRQLNEYELECFRLNTELESLYIHWSTYLNALFVNKNKNINKIKSDLKLLISQIKKLKARVGTFESKLETSKEEFENKLKGYYQKYLTFQFVNAILKISKKGVTEEGKSEIILKIKELYNKKIDSELNLSQISKTDYYESLPPSVIISTENSKENSIFNLYSDKYKNEENQNGKDNIINVKFDNIWDEFTNNDILNQPLFQKNIKVDEWTTYKVEWEASFLPNKEGHYINNSGIFNEDFISNTYGLDELNADIIKNNDVGNIAFMPNSNTYYGNAFVGNTVKKHLLDTLKENSEKIENKVNKNIVGVINNAIDNLNKTDVLELTLSDFNNQLLQRSNALTVLPLIPNGFSDHQNLAKEITDLLTSNKKNLNLLTPNKYSVFNPFRNGAFRLNSLRIVDSFGRNIIIQPTKTLTTQYQKINNKPQWIELPPRYLQPASVDIDFDVTSTNQHSSPVIGWIIPFYLTQKLEFFDTNGKHLGSLDDSGNWESSPFEITIAKSGENYKEIIENIHLTRIVDWIKIKCKKGERKTKFMSAFIKNTQDAMANCFPEDNSNPSLLETISTIPIAITLVNINLYTKGEALYDLNFDEKISINTYDNQRQYDRVKMPMSIGDVNQYNDGVLGYWHGDLDSYYKEIEFTNEAKMPNLESEIYFEMDGSLLKGIYTGINSKKNDKKNYLRLNENRNSCKRYVLMHPKGSLNVKTGFLPVSSTKIPFDQIKNALKKIELTMLTAPILTKKESLEMSLSKDSRYRWSWIELHKTKKDENPSLENNSIKTELKKNRITQDLAIELKQGQFNRYKKFFDENEFLIYDENQNKEDNIFYINEEKWMELFNKENKDERELEIYELFKNNVMSIPPFNVTRPSHSRMVLKEGWLAIKSTKI